jgi:Nickel/cobalt transporter regulator
MVRAALRLLAIASLFAFVAPNLASAQEQKDQHKGPPPHPSGGGAPPPHPSGPHPPGPQFKPAEIPHGPAPGPVGGPPPPLHPSGGPEFAHPGPGSPEFAHPGPGGPVFAHPSGPPAGGPQFSYRGRTFERMHVNPYVYPQGWGYRQWAIGAFLPPFFLTPDYFYPDWAALGFPPPPPGTQWVRYGPDLLLVDTTTGEVVDVAYGVFYD